MRFAASVLLFFAGCAASTPPGEARLEPAAAPPAPARDLGELDLSELALIVSGFESPEALRGARFRLEDALREILAEARALEDPEAQARALLTGLHRRRVFDQYDARATTLAEVLEGGRFNCLSASIVYNLLAERVGLRTAGQLLPTHARSLVFLPRERGESPVVVETTSLHGFDPDPKTQAAILEQVAAPAEPGRRSLVSDRGVVVTTMVLIGAMYVNRGSIAQEAGDIAAAEALFQRAETMPIDEPMRIVLRDHRAALLSQLAADDIASNEAERLSRAYRTTLAAAALNPQDAEIRRVTQQNLRAAAERLIARAADAGDEKRIDAIRKEAEGVQLDPAQRAGLRAFALSEVARLAVAQGRFDRAIGAIDDALGEKLTAQDSALKGTLEQNLFATLRLAAATEAKGGNVRRSLQLIERLESVPGLSGEQREAAAQDKLNVRLLAAQKRYQDGDHRGAAHLYKEALRDFPNDPTAKHNLVAALERAISEDVNAGRCESAAPLLAELRAAAPQSTYPARAETRCLVSRANDRLQSGDAEAAVELLKRARVLQPDDPLVARNLAVGLVRWSRALEAKNACAEARKKIAEVRAIHNHGLSETDLALSRCR